MEQTSGAGPGLDSSYRSSGVFVGKPVTADISVTAFDPPRRFAIRSDQHQEGKKDVWYVNDYTLAPEGGGTRVSKRVTSNGNPLIFFIAYPADPGRSDDVAPQPEEGSRVEQLSERGADGASPYDSGSMADEHPEIDLANPDSYVRGVPHDWFDHLRHEHPVFWHPERAAQQGVLGGDPLRRPDGDPHGLADLLLGARRRSRSRSSTTSSSRSGSRCSRPTLPGTPS